MASYQWSSEYKQMLSDSQLTLSQRLSCGNVMESLGEMENKLKCSVSDGDFQVSVWDSADSLLNSIQWVRDSFLRYGVTEITVKKNSNNLFGSVTVRAQATADNSQTYDETIQKDEQAVPAINPTTNISNNTKTDTTATPTQLTGNADTLSENAQSTVAQNVDNTSEFFLNVEVYLEGVQIPHSSATVSYGLVTPPSATIIMPASSILRDLPEYTKVQIFFEDLLPDETGVYQWRLLFDGELAGFQYNADANGATMSITALHSSAYTTLMQIMTLDASEYLFNPNPLMVGPATMPLVMGHNKISTKLISNIMNGKGYESMADIVYQLMRAILEGTTDSAVGKYYHDKLGNDKNGWKILKRMYGVSKATANSPVPRYDSQYKTGSSSTGTGTNGQRIASNGKGNDAIVQAAMTYIGNTGRDTNVDGISPFQCDGLVTAALRKSGMEPSGWPEHWVPSQQEFMQNAGIYSENPNEVVPGDIIVMNCYDEADHIAIFMRDESGAGYLIHNSASKRETIQTAWEPPGWDGFAYLGHGHINA